MILSQLQASLAYPLALHLYVEKDQTALNAVRDFDWLQNFWLSNEFYFVDKENKKWRIVGISEHDLPKFVKIQTSVNVRFTIHINDIVVESPKE